MRDCECPQCGHRFTPGIDPEWIARVITARLRQGMVASTLARKLGISPSYISDVEKGNRYVPAPDLKRKWEEALGL